MTLYRLSALEKERPLEYPDEPDRYQLYFIDEDESEHAPEYDMGPRNPDEPIGEFPALAFVENKKYKGSKKNTSENIVDSEQELLRKKFEKEDKWLIQVVFNIATQKQKIKSIVVDNSAKIGSIFN